MKSIWNDYVLLMKKEIVPALGCTEPVSVALAAATAMKYLKDHNITAINVLVSPNLMKNGMAVGVPGTGMKGLPIAAAAGACGGDAEAKLEVLKGLNTSSLESGHARIQRITTVEPPAVNKFAVTWCFRNDQTELLRNPELLKRIKSLGMTHMYRNPAFD